MADVRLDAYWKAFAAAGLLAVTLIAAGFSAPAARRTWSSANPRRFLPGFALAAAAIGTAYLVLAIVSTRMTADVALRPLARGGAAAWVIGGQCALAFAEETYYRGLVLHEVHRLAPRLGLLSSAARRWAALLFSAGLFAMEHVSGSLDPATLFRETVFALALGLLFGLLVLLTGNLWIVATLHAWINVLLMGVFPRFTVGGDSSTFTSGVYIALALAGAIGLAVGYAGRRGTFRV
jgi:membrane protease YdiL (CAAX protease family)